MTIIEELEPELDTKTIITEKSRSYIEQLLKVISSLNPEKAF